jgi:hypothetical protein
MVDNRSVRFTSGGKMYVIDAISALSEAALANDVWIGLKKDKPEINQYKG